MVSKCISLIRLLCQDSFSFTCCIRTLQCFSHTQFCIRCLQNIYNVLHHVWTLEVRLAVRHLDRSPPPQHEPPFWFLLSCSSWARGLGVFLWWILFKIKKKNLPSLPSKSKHDGVYSILYLSWLCFHDFTDFFFLLSSFTIFKQVSMAQKTVEGTAGRGTRWLFTLHSGQNSPGNPSLPGSKTGIHPVRRKKT